MNREKKEDPEVKQSESDSPPIGNESFAQAPKNQMPLQNNSFSSLYKQLSNNSSMFLNPHAVAQAASVALATAAAQQASQQTTNDHSKTPVPVNLHRFSPIINTSTGTDGNDKSVNTQQPANSEKGNVQSSSDTNSISLSLPSTISDNSPSGIVQPQAFSSHQQQQIVMNAQVAALLAAGVSPAMILNGSNTFQQSTSPPAMNSAQAFLSWLQQQQQPPQQQPPQQPLPPQPTQQQTQPLPPPPTQQQQQQQQNSQTTQAMMPSVQMYFKEPTASTSKSPNPPSVLHKYKTSDPNNPRVNYQTKTIDNKSTPSIISTNNDKLSQSGPSTATAALQQNKVNNMFASAAASNNTMLFAQMQGWKLEQLEAYCHLLTNTNQPIPQPVSLLLSEARRKEEKRTAKRVANRKSACTSRARKKAFVEEMTRTNARLKRQAVILSLLPDLVVAIKLNGDITFCSAQVGRVLRRNEDSLVGTNINEILVPSSRNEISRLIQKLIAAEKAALDEYNKEGDESGGSSNSGNNSSAAIVSEQSEQGFPPLAVVKVSSNNNETHRDDVTGETVTPNNAGARLSSLQHRPEFFKQSSNEPSLSHQNVQLDKMTKTSGMNFENQEDLSSSTSTDSLLNGVEDKRKGSRAHENGSDDRQSADSEFADSSSSADTSNNAIRPRPLAPTCTVCLIRDNLTTIWCEVTSSIRTRSVNEEMNDVLSNSSVSVDKRKVNSLSQGVASGDTGSEGEQVKELLLCLRPICKGKSVEEEKLPPTKSEKEPLSENETDSSNREDTNKMNKIRPMKKRLLSALEENENCKKAMAVKSSNEAEKSVVESLILMSSHKI